MILSGLFCLMFNSLAFSGVATSETAVDARTAVESSSDQDVTLTATVTVTGSGTPISTGEVSFQVKDSGNNNVGTAVVDTSLTAAGIAEVTYTLPAGIVGAFTIQASYSDSFATFGTSMGSNSLIVTPARVYVDAAGDFTITGDVAPLGGSPTSGDTVTWSSLNLGDKTGAVFGTNAFSSIQSAVDAVSDGGLVFIADGTYLEGAEISIAKSVRLFGDDRDTTFLDGADTHRVVNIHNGAFDVQLRDLTIQNGNAAGAVDGGAGVLSVSSGAVTISNSILTGNNSNSNGANLAGGGAIRINGSGMVSIANSTILENSADDAADNGGGGGGGIFNNGGVVVLSRSTVRANSASADMGAGLGGGGVFNNSGTVTIDKSTVTANDAGKVGGGGVRNASTLIVTNSTISGNGVGGVGTDEGGGIYNSGTVTVTNATITGNAASFQGTSAGGGIFNDGGSVTLHNSIVAGNASSNSPDISSSALSSNGANFVGDATGTILAAGDKTFASTSTTIVNLLDTNLADNGGSTLTHNLILGSPAIDAANDADVPTPTAPVGVEPAPPSDQTGRTRFVDGDGNSSTTADIGALEFVPVIEPLFDTQIGVAKNATVLGRSITFDFYVENLGKLALNNLSLSDDLDAVFGAGNYAVVSGPTLESSAIAVTLNGAFDGTTNTALITSGTLDPGEQMEIQIVVDVLTPVDLGSGLGIYSNQVTATADSSGGSTSDLSDNGTDPDANGNGDPTDAGEDDPTPMSLFEAPKIGLAKTVKVSGTQVTFDFYVENLGNISLGQLTLTDDLDTVFGAGNYSVLSGPGFIVDPGTITLNGGFNGSGDPALISSGTLNSGVTAVIRLIVDVTNVVDRGGGLGVYSNQASVMGETQYGTTATDLSDNGIEPDPNGSGDASDVGENDPTTFALGEEPALGVAQTASVSGTEVTFDIYLENLGNTTVSDLYLPHGLDAVFGASHYTVSSMPTLVDDPGSVALNPTFDGGSDVSIIANGSSLASGDTAQIRFVVTVFEISDQGGGLGVYSSQIPIRAVAPAGQVVNDFSDNGTDPDPNGNGDPDEAGENDATGVTIAENPVIGVSKEGLLVISGGATYIDWIWHIENLGNVDLFNLTMSDNLNAVFGAGNFSHITDPSSDGTIIGNAAYNGNTNTSVLSSGTLAVGQSATITARSLLTNVTDQGFGLGVYQNQVTINATTAGSVPVSDVSHSGVDPDPNGDGNPSEMDPTVIDVNNVGVIGIAVDAVVSSGNQVTVDVYLENLGAVPVSEVSLVANLDSVFGSGSYVFGSVPAFIDDPGTLSLNPAFGVSDVALLEPQSSSLAVGDTAQIRFTLVLNKAVNTGLGLGNYSLQMTASGIPVGGRQVSDTSDFGTDPDPNGNGNPNEGGENDATTFSVAAGTVGAAKSIAIAGRQVTIDIYLEQFGNGPSVNVSVIEDLDSVFGNGNYSITSAPSFVVDPGTLVLNGSYDGIADTDLLVPGSSSMNSGSTAQIQLVVNVATIADSQGIGTGAYNNQVTVTSTDPIGLTTEDLSTEGTDPDTNGDGDPSGESAQNFIVLGNAAIGISKKAIVSGTVVTVEFAIENLGENQVKSILLSDPLNPVFGSGNYSILAQPSLIEGPNTLSLSPQFFGFNIFDRVVAGGSLEPGEVARIRVRINVNTVTDVGNGFGIYFNGVTVNATDPAGLAVSDASDDGYLADPNGNGDAGDTGENDPTQIIIGDEANLGVAMTATVGSGTQQVTVDVHLENLGGSMLNGVTVLDDLDAVFGAGNYTINSAPVFVDDPGTINLNAGFDGSGDTNLIAAASSLAAFDTAQFRFVVDVTNVTDQGMGVGVYQSQVTAAGTAPLGSVAIDLSDSGTDPDPSGNGFANDSGESDPTSFTVVEQRTAIGVAKNASVSGNDVTFDYYLENLGSTSIDTLSLADDLDVLFGSGNYSVSSPALLISSPRSVTVNTAFNGSSDTELISSGTMVANEKVQIRVVVRVSQLIDGGSGLGIYSSQVTLNGQVVSVGTPVSDLSDSGVDPDSNGNADATEAGENDPTTFAISQDPRIGVAMAASVSNQSVTFDFYLESFGNVAVSSLSLVEDLDALFGAGNYSISSGPSMIDDPGTITLDGGFDGSASNDLFTSGSALAIGDTAQIRIVVDVTTVTDQGSGLGIYSNQVTASGQSPDSTATSDLSDSGTDSDPNGNGDPTDAGENDATSIVLQSTVRSRVFNDLNGNGTDDTEPGLSGVTVFLDLNTNGSLDGGEPSVMTPASGEYSFENLAAGTYSVKVVPGTVSAGFVLTTAGNPLSTSLDAGENQTSVAFGYQLQTASIGDFVWKDLDGDGVQDGGEPGLSGVTVFLD
ncbi:MAG: Ig-like domain repeat protein, partial [Verrucomicrobiae bacterium]|nr:Ig-like domain repeat protein [Verrucomicrobiae bacterium]